MGYINHRLEYEKYLNKLSFEEQIAELHHFLLDMKDWKKDTGAEKIYTSLLEDLSKY
jgi:hypothetical protein